MKKKISFLVITLIIAVLLPTTVAIDKNVVLQSQSLLTLQPSIEFYPKSHDFGYVETGEIYYTTFEIWNNGTGVLAWEILLLSPWVSVIPLNGTSTGEHDLVTVSICTTNLTSGVHTTNILINSSNATELHYFSISLVINNPPNTPNRPSGPSSGIVGTSYLYSTKATDPDGDTICYGVDVHGDEIVDYWSPYYYPSGSTFKLYITFSSAGTYHLRFIAKDIHGALSNFSIEKTVVISNENHPPETPQIPDGPDNGSSNISYSFTTSSTDQDEDEIRYGWDWNGDNTIDEWTDYYESGDAVTRTHRFLDPGTYYIKVIAEDEFGMQSGFSPTKSITIIGNTAPNKPSRPVGSSQGRIGRSYTYSTSTTDPDGDYIYYLFDWGDNNDSGWIGPYASGQMASESHVWHTRGSFAVKVKAKDDPNGDGNLSDGIESVWSNPLPITMPKTKEIYKVNSVFAMIYQFIRDILRLLTEFFIV
jgi:hypothetical protein